MSTTLILDIIKIVVPPIGIFLGTYFLKIFNKMANDINEIKTNVSVHGKAHEDLEKRVVRIEDKVF